ncbi:MAG TPA: ATP-binding protein [Rhodocyclaceae bacterium]|nr:ATP-binding protein [Rhodocyclaceae bacterium]
MATTSDSSPPELRRRTQRRVRGRRHDDMSQDIDAPRLLHELRVHQIELEMQNDELRQAQSLAETALDSYTELYDFAPVGYFTLDRDGAIHQLNLAGAALLGGERGTLVGKRFGQFVAVGDRADFNTFLARTLGDRNQYSREFRLLNPQDADRSLVVRMEAASDLAGRRLKVAALDITERKRAVEELVQSNVELRQLAVAAARDLESPLSSIQALVDQLQEEAAGQPEGWLEAWAGRMAQQAERIQALIQDLRAYSRSGARGRSFARVDMADLMAELLTSLQPLISGTGAVITVDGALPIVMGDRMQLAHLLRNLIGNGIRHRAPGRTGPPRIRISSQRRPGGWTIAVQGGGLATVGEPLLDVFQQSRLLPFQPAYPATGLGLAVCRRIVQGHGGRIWVEWDSDRDSVFRFTLPDIPGP